MTSRARFTICLFTALPLLAPPPAGAQQTPPPPAAPVDDAVLLETRQKDLAFLASELIRLHPALADAGKTREEFDATLRKIEARLPAMSDHQVAFAFARLAACIGDLHTCVDLNSAPFKLRNISFTFWWFPDGLRAVIVPTETKHLLGCKLVRVDGVPIAEAIKRLRPFFPVENVWTERQQAPRWVTCAEALDAAGLLDRLEKVNIVVADTKGVETSLDLLPLAAGSRPSLVGATDPGSPARQSLLYSDQRSAWWKRALPEEGGPGSLYIQYNRCADDPNAPMAAFAADLLKSIDAQPPRRIIIDLRNNSGGNSQVLAPLIEGLAQRKDALAGRVVTLVSRHTMSSALMNAVQLRDRCGARVMGEPPGQRVNHYGEVRSFTLPASGLKVYHSTKQFRMEQRDADLMALDVEAVATWDDFISGKDPALEAALRP